ncbi:hypothetical protein llap_9930 [Limosa lapponica baueri]|uniref:Uncharacterized protein n=1 Tax=Limosa lapponica baueri TaxID=1758121 RepID=A0A2I0U130_LIMLA|nr:hypothetical protein llap_9930 [Limosa lapponica baueri]
MNDLSGKEDTFNAHKTAHSLATFRIYACMITPWRQAPVSAALDMTRFGTWKDNFLSLKTWNKDFEKGLYLSLPRIKKHMANIKEFSFTTILKKRELQSLARTGGITTPFWCRCQRGVNPVSDPEQQQSGTWSQVWRRRLALSTTFIFISHHRNQPERFTTDGQETGEQKGLLETPPSHRGTAVTYNKHTAKANPIPGKQSQPVTLLKDEPVQLSGDEPAECCAPKPTSALQESLGDTPGYPP